ncbi:acyl-CoA dehydrogenase (plasmid) [Burkholderia sp. THE68]|uniref:acyl-CoA dehydrogenase family protein n=1 Tax=Burkholderia sp. THE68 TaxID=758782 RepID=UPI0013181C93|nr:acyl-CoA dehydrogenase [Burkholderia sp. THE68]BBU32489.1 acyl-CoA dehydrogenase [Burkholderia sp. THE68]
MDFSYSEEQRQLADSLRRFTEERYPIDARRHAVRYPDGFSRDAWRTYADFGVLGLTIASDYGGFDGTATDTFAVQFEAGRALLPEPLIPCAVMAAGLIQRFGSDAQRQARLPEMAEGREIVTLAYQEPESRYDYAQPETTARVQDDGFVLDGHKVHVWHGGAAHSLIVSAWNASIQAMSLFIVPTAAAGVTVRAYPTLDGERAAEVTVQAVRVPQRAMLGDGAHGAAMIEAALELGIAASCAASAGAMERLIEMTSEYLCTRKQFGQALGRFQALRHRLADMLVQKELALSMAHLAASAIGETDATERRRMISSAKLIVSRAARFIGEQAVQLHGGMGVTAELAVGDYFKYLTAASLRLGDADFHADVLANLPLDHAPSLSARSRERATASSRLDTPSLL